MINYLKNNMYILFSGNNYYPLGGCEDFVGTFKTIGDAIKAYNENVLTDDELDWANIFCTTKNKAVKFCSKGFWADTSEGASELSYRNYLSKKT